MDRKRMVGFLLLLSALLTLCVVFALRGPVAKQKVRGIILPDGRELRVEASTFGSTHKVDLGQQDRWLGVFKRWETNSHTGGKTHEPSLMVWLSVPSTNSSIPLSEPQLGPMSIVADNGQVIRLRRPTGTPSGTMEFGRFLYLPVWPSFPRRQDTFTLTGSVDRLPFSIQVTNPLAGKTFPTWATVDLPATNRIGDVDFVLPGVSLRRGNSLLVEKLKAFQNGQDVTERYFSRWQVEDATGNQFFIFTNEPALKLSHTILSRLPYSQITNGFHEIELSGPLSTGEVRQVTGKALDGLAVDYLYLGGPGTYKFDTNDTLPPQPQSVVRTNGYVGWDRGYEWSFQGHWCIADFIGVPTSHEVLVFLRNQRGETVPVNRAYAATDGVNCKVLYFLDGPQNRWRSRTKEHHLRLEKFGPPPYTMRIAIRKILQPEFIIDPRKLRVHP